MNEQRTQAYLTLINQLLSCNEGYRLRILQENEELLDHGLIKVMIAVAQQFEKTGRENEAQWLMNIAQQLQKDINRKKVNIEEYLQFLNAIVKAEFENDDSTIVYPILQHYQDKLDDTFAQLLQVNIRHCLSHGDQETITDLVGVLANVCSDIQWFSGGSRSNNLEIAIIGYETILEVYTREDFPQYPQQWAVTQNNLGTAYNDRIKGEKAENIELAIVALQKSLEVYARETFPYEWARTHNNLGFSYQERIKGEKAENIELAIVALQKSLEVYSYEEFPDEWAMTQNNLGAIYSERIKGGKIRKYRISNCCFTELFRSLFL